ncbi:MAG TPA: DUF2785 domain-containing protein [Steroidobacteraceae bacterium]|jgi:hypothetical protein|nr:DUF2785 domain-containing protein [Steroidobacteraceae bacterium]
MFNRVDAEHQTTVHDRAFWVALRATGFKLPSSQPVLPLALEATSLLGSTDPELRDAVAYEALATWIYQDERLDAGELDRLRVTLTTNARRGLGDGVSDGLFLRSFSTLVLSVLAAEDLKKPFLDSQQFDGLVALGIDELGSERDLRGYVPGKGWGHATAHCADLLKFLGRSHWLRPEQQAGIVAAIAGRLRSAGLVFVWGEDARLAAALTSLARRTDADPAPFNAWFKQLSEEHAAVWSGPFDPVRYVPVRAQLNALSSFAADIDTVQGPGAAILTAVRTLRSAAQ